MGARRLVAGSIAGVIVLSSVTGSASRQREMPAAAPTRPAFSASGHEPGWRMDIARGTGTAAGRLTLQRQGSPDLTLTAPRVETMGNGRRYSGSAGARAIVVTIINTICADPASGLPRPNTVEVDVDGTTLRGCGGDPGSLLLGAPWVVQSIGDAPPVDRSQLSIAFSPDGRVSGGASCNTFSGPYRVTASGLTIGPIVTTRKACSGPLMEQESALIAILSGVRVFELTADRVLILRAADARTIRAAQPARRPQ
jgi:heat shock protein HslJ/uncharacterized membrane protein